MIIPTGSIPTEPQAAVVLPPLWHAILPRPYTPRHKGKVEAGVGYVKTTRSRGAVRQPGRAEAHLLHWEETVADTRVHGTTRRQVARVFEEVERAALLPLPRRPFTNFQEGQRRVQRDGLVEVAKAYY